MTVGLLATLGAEAAQSPKALAKDSLAFLNRMESMLQGSIRSGDAADLYRFVEQPTIEMMQKWPPMSNASYNDFRRCQFALDAFRSYAPDQFKARGKLPKSSVTYKDYLDQKRQCAALVK